MNFTGSKLIAISFCLFAFVTLFSCKSNSSSAKNYSDSTISKVSIPEKTATQLYSEGMEILNERISIQASNKEKALELNENAIKMFSAAYNLDTTLADPVLFASECTLYSKNYQKCIYWTSKLKRLDTSQLNLIFCDERINYCYKQLSLQEK